VENRETRLISGKGQYADDLDFPGMAHLVFVGSPHAHAVIKRLDVDKALKVPGVLTVITGEEMVKYTNPLPVQANFKSKGWTWRLANVYAMPKDKFAGMVNLWPQWWLRMKNSPASSRSCGS